MLNAKYGVDFGFEPSPFQEKIFDFILHGNGNAVIAAKPGSGKTTTCVSAIKLINPKESVIFLAFNKSIAEELSNRLQSYANVVVRTSHSLGYAILRKNVDGDVELDEYKYRTYLKQNVKVLSDIYANTLNKKQCHEYIENVSLLINFARFNLAQTPREVKIIATKYDIPIIADECETVIKVLEWGKTVLNCVDYTDMVWLPVELSMKTNAFRYNFIFVDEFQDISMMANELFLKCLKRGGRIICVGDEKQAINQFSGCSEESFNYMKNQPKTTVFDLPICYRCPRKVVELAQTLVPDIIPMNDCIDGTIIDNCFTSVFKSGDMVLCRTKAPLIRTYTKLLRNGVKCYIKGQDIGNNLKNIINDINIEDLNVNLKDDGVFVRLYDTLFTMRNNLMTYSGLDYEDATLSSIVMERYDIINALSVLAERYTTKTELMRHIDDIFSDNGDGVMLSTIHKAKGLEADNVYILCNSSMPLSIASKDWEKVAEQNLIYVAYTRAKKKLGFVSENEIKPFGISQGSDNILNELGLIETAVCKILNKTPIAQKNAIEVARFNIKNGITKIKDTPIAANVKVINKTQDIPYDILSELEI